jgi:hypothetical protein
MDLKTQIKTVYRLKLSSADNLQTRLRSIASLKQESMKEEITHIKASQSDPSCGLSKNTNIKPGYLL